MSDGRNYLIIVQINMVKHVNKQQNSCNLQFSQFVSGAFHIIN